MRYRIQPDALHTRNAFPFSARNWCVSGAGEITTDSAHTRSPYCCEPEVPRADYLAQEKLFSFDIPHED